MKGTWVKVDDRMSEHPKIVEAGHLAAWLYTAGLLYSSRNLSDGFIPSGIVPRLTDIPDPASAAAKLCEVGLWHPELTGFRIHDYTDHQRSREEIEAEREANRERQRRFQSKKATVAGAKEKKSSDVPNLDDLALQLVGPGGVLDEQLAASDSPTSAYLAALDVAAEFAPQCRTKSPDPVAYVQNKVVFRAASDLHDISIDKAKRFASEAKVLGPDGRRWIITALARTASSDITGDPVSYVIAVARKLVSESKTKSKAVK